MTFIPLAIHRIAKSNQISRVAIGQSLTSRSQRHLFTGGREPMMMFLDGEFSGHAYEALTFRPVDVLVIEEIEFEVDPASMEIAELVNRPIGGLTLSPSGRTGIIVIRRDRHGFEDAIEVFFDDQSPEKRLEESRVYFPTWKAYKRVGDDKHLLFEMNAEARAR